MPTGCVEDDVAARIKAARLLRGVTQEELARRLAEAGLSARTAGALERGAIEMRAIHRTAICEALNMSETWFLAPVDKILGFVTEDPAVSIEQQMIEILQRLDELADKLS